MDLVTEDSYGLYELVWRMHSLFADLSEGACLEMARDAAFTLAELGWLALVPVRHSPQSGFNPEVALEDDANWLPFGGNAAGFELIATDDGRKAYMDAACCARDVHIEFRRLNEQSRSASGV